MNCCSKVKDSHEVGYLSHKLLATLPYALQSEPYTIRTYGSIRDPDTDLQSQRWATSRRPCHLGQTVPWIFFEFPGQRPPKRSLRPSIRLILTRG